MSTEIKILIPTLYNFSLLYQMSSSSCSEFGTGPSRCRSSLDLDKIFRRDTISPLLGPQLKKNEMSYYVICSKGKHVIKCGRYLDNGNYVKWK